MMPPRTGSAHPTKAYSPKCVEKGCSRKCAYSILHRTPPQGRKESSSAHPHLVTDGLHVVVLNRECATTVDWGRTALVSCAALHSPVCRTATPGPRPSRRR